MNSITPLNRVLTRSASAASDFDLPSISSPGRKRPRSSPDDQELREEPGLNPALTRMSSAVSDLVHSPSLPSRKRPCPVGGLELSSKPNSAFPYYFPRIEVRCPSLNVMSEVMDSLSTGMREKHGAGINWQDQHHVSGLFYTDSKPLNTPEQTQYFQQDRDRRFDLTTVHSPRQREKAVEKLVTTVVSQSKWSPAPFHRAQELNSNSKQPYIDRTPSFVRAVIGVIGGMGFDATCLFVQEVHHMNPYIRLLADQNTNIPGRTDGLKGDPAPVVEELFQSALRLHAARVSYVAIPCNTSHAFLPALKNKYLEHGISVPYFIEMPTAVIKEIGREFGSEKMPVKAMILSTDGTRQAKLYPQAAAAVAATQEQLVTVECMAPELQQQNIIDGSIDKTKAGDIKGATQDFKPILLQCPKNVQVIVGACTEIPLILTQKHMPSGVKFISSTHVLAKAICAVAGI
jgi:aspartate racemase